MFPVIKTFFQLHLWPFWGLAETSPESKKVNFDERGNLISTGPSTHGDHLIRFSNRKRLKEHWFAGCGWNRNGRILCRQTIMY